MHCACAFGDNTCTAFVCLCDAEGPHEGISLCYWISKLLELLLRTV